MSHQLMFINLKRILKFSWYSFVRNKGLGLQVVFIMTIALFFILVFFLGRGVSMSLMDEIGRKVDISVYFKSGTTEQEILKIKDQLSLLSDKVKNIEYISKERALTIFKSEHQNDELYTKAIEEAKENPLLPSLNIYSDDPNYYTTISDFLNSQSIGGVIEKISYEQPKHKQAIERLAQITAGVKIIGVIIMVLMALLVVVITSNIIKLTFIILKEEIGTMKLVGASNWFVRGPFIVQTFFYGLFAVIVVDVLIGVLLYSFSTRLMHWFSNFNLFNYFIHNFLIIFAFQLGFVILAGMVSALLVIRKHLKV